MAQVFLSGLRFGEGIMNVAMYHGHMGAMEPEAEPEPETQLGWNQSSEVTLGWAWRWQPHLGEFLWCPPPPPGPPPGYNGPAW